MPSRAPRICGACGHTHLTGEQCAIIAARTKARNAKHDAKRPSARQRGYNAEWDKARAAFLAVYSSCARCGANATVVDHRIPHKGDDALFWDRRNWQPLCSHCHNSHKQAAERRAPRN